MLEYKINKNRLSLTESEIAITRTAYGNNEIFGCDGEISKMYRGGTVVFKREECENIYFREEKAVKDIDETHFFVEKFKDIQLTVESTEIFDKRMWYNDSLGGNYSGVKRFIKINLNKETPHNAVSGRCEHGIDVEIDGTTFTYDGKICPGDHILYGKNFLYRAGSVNNGEYGDIELISIKDIAVKIKLSEEQINTYFGGVVNLNGGSWELNEGILTLKGCIVPVLDTNVDDVYTLLWPCMDDNIQTLLLDSYEYFALFIEDMRFFRKVEDVEGELNEKYEIYESTTVSFANNSIKLFNLFGNSEDVGLGREEAFNLFFESEKKRNKNAIIDYEKQVFTPVYSDDTTFDSSKLHDATEIDFNLHFRDRWVEDETILSKDWKTDDSKFWNSHKSFKSDIIGNTTERLIKLQESESLASDSDLLGYLGFTDDDVFYRKKKIEKSFLRLSFYDTPDRRTQNLLFTSTIFLDGGRAYSRYIQYITDGAEPPGGTYVIDDKIELEKGFTLKTQRNSKGDRLSADFFCRNKYDNTASSEGFYLYLFPSILEKQDEIYMKVEFNHAKYGHTIPFIMPVNGNNKPLQPTDDCFPIHYMRGDGKGGIYVDTNRLFNDMYIRVKLKYDSERNRYVWMLPRQTDSDNGEMDGKIIINLFEPRINAGTAQEIQNIDIRSQICYLDSSDEEQEQQTEEYAYSVTTTYRMPRQGEYKIINKKQKNRILNIVIDGKKVSYAESYYLEKGSHTIVFAFKSDSIPEGAFAQNNYITAINKMSGITAIGNSAFNNCPALSSANLIGVKYVYKMAFQGDRLLKTVENTDMIKKIDTAAFGHTGIHYIDLSGCGDIKSIGDFAFSKCYKLEDVEPPSGISGDMSSIVRNQKGWGRGAFMDCRKLEKRGAKEIREMLTIEGTPTDEQLARKENRECYIDPYFCFLERQ